MKMKQFIHAVFCALTVCGFLLLGASCSKENEPIQTVEGVTVTIAAQSDLQTRTSLPVYDGDYGNNISGVQHVTDVYLYIYEMNKERNDGECKARFNVGWKEHFGTDIPTETAEMQYTFAYTFTVGKIYRLVAVGVDGATEQDNMPGYDGMNSIETYGLPKSIEIGSKLTAPITLQEGRTPVDMAHSEFFTGYVDFTPKSESDKHIDEINLWRRVAGLQVCLNQIPKEVERVRILLYNSQNTQVKLLPSAPQESETDKIITDFITSPYGNDSFNEEGRVLMDKTFTEDDLYLPGSGTGVVSDYAYKCSLTAFMLPVNIPDRELYDYTLVAEFVTTSMTGIVGSSKKVRLIKPWQNSDGLDFEDETDIGTGIIDDLDKYLFPIEANHFYCLGIPSKPIDCSGVLQ